jgi:hypothetical protein
MSKSFKLSPFSAVLAAVTCIFLLAACEADKAGVIATGLDTSKADTTSGGAVLDTTGAPTPDPGPQGGSAAETTGGSAADSGPPTPDPGPPTPDTGPPIPDPGPPTTDPGPPTLDVGPQVDCGDATCSPGEDPCTCPADCPVGGGAAGQACCAAEDCAQPKCGPCCKVHCEDFKCTEPVWLAPCCWNNECEEGETPESCPQDCPPPETTDCEENGGECKPWDPDYSECGPGTEPSGHMCRTRSEVCCVQSDPSTDCADFYACTEDTDCIKTNGGCCSCSMGGQSIAIRASCVGEYQEGLECRPDLMCSAVYRCDDSVAVCKEGKCELEGGGSVGPIE